MIQDRKTLYKALTVQPARLRKKAADDARIVTGTGTSALQLSYRPPYDWLGMLAFLKMRELKGVEWVTDSFYSRTVHLDEHKGWIKVSQTTKRNAVMLEFAHSLTPVLPALLSRVRDLFDLNARPDIITRQLSKDKVLAPLVKANPGMRVPGAFKGFEMGLRAILGQQITVKAATTIAGRLIAAFGESFVTPYPELNRLTPAPALIAQATVDDLARHGILGARCKSIIALAQAEVSGKLSLDSGTHHNPAATIEHLAELPGIGQWTAHYIAMRALRWPDAFPKGDIAVLNNLGGVTAKQAELMSQAWRPWRSYAVLYIWNIKKDAVEI
jgi:AraC family transcriptional regulator of adaptative response / DNA-3-methyladenine glycosylase II